MSRHPLERSRRLILDEYTRARDRGLAALRAGQARSGLPLLHYAARIAQKYPVIEAYCDEELERGLEQYVSQAPVVAGDLDAKARVAFYNSQIVDRGGLTEQYLDFLLEYHYEVLLILPDRSQTRLGKGILRKIAPLKNVEVFIASGNEPEFKIQEIRARLNVFRPGLAFLHMVPADVVGFSSFVHSRNLARYFIDHNDHTFWLGKLCSDFFLEFREYGAILSRERRQIAPERIAKQPYYPILENVPFKGFPFERAGVVVGVSGANLYKYLVDPDCKYFHLIKDLLHLHPELVFCLCGWGDEQTVRHFIDKNDLAGRFYFLGKRDDFNALVSRCDIFFESYPIRGGLTPQFAIANQVPVLGLYDNYSENEFLEDLYHLDSYQRCRDRDEFIRHAGELVKSKARRRQVAQGQRLTTTRQVFNSRLRQVIDGQLRTVLQNQPRKIAIDDAQILAESLRGVDDAREVLTIIKASTLRGSATLRQKIEMAATIGGLHGLSHRKRMKEIAKVFATQP